MSERILPNLILKSGGYRNPNEGACVMNVAHMAMGAQRLANGVWSGVDISDLPECTHPAVARVAQRAWDQIDGVNTPEHLVFLARFLPRLMRAKRTENLRISVRIALAAARSVEHLAPPEVKACNDTVEAWLTGSATLDDVRNAHTGVYAAGGGAAAVAAGASAAAAVGVAVYAAGGGADTAYADADTAGGDAADTAYADAADTAYAATIYAADGGAVGAAVDALDMILDAHEKALAEEGEAVWDPAPWEDDAIAFVDTLCAEIRDELAARAVS